MGDGIKLLFLIIFNIFISNNKLTNKHKQTKNMKKIVLIATAVLLLSSCGSTKKEEVAVAVDTTVVAPVTVTPALEVVTDTLLKAVEVTPTVTGVVKAK